MKNAISWVFLSVGKIFTFVAHADQKHTRRKLTIRVIFWFLSFVCDLFFFWRGVILNVILSSEMEKAKGLEITPGDPTAKTVPPQKEHVETARKQRISA